MTKILEALATALADGNPYTIYLILAVLLIIVFAWPAKGVSIAIGLGIRHCYRWLFGCKRGKHQWEPLGILPNRFALRYFGQSWDTPNVAIVECSTCHRQTIGISY